MSERVLPDDLDEWPDDPFALLGVPHTADAKVVRRAYAALIRRYKPEHAPDAFQRIRKAYEDASQWIAWQKDFPEESEGESSHDDKPASPAGATSSPPEKSSSRPPFSPPRPPDPDVGEAARAAWKVAADGNWEEAWRQLGGLDKWAPEVADRVHWLRTLRPELANLGAPPEAPRDDAPHSVPVTAALRMIFLEEMRRSPEVAYSLKADAWWRAPLSRWERVEFIRTRWTAAARVDAFRLIEGDVERGRWFLRDERNSWFDLVVMGIGLTWTSCRPEAERCRQRLEKALRELADLHLAHSTILEKLDLMRVLSRHLTGIPGRHYDSLMRLGLRGLFCPAAETQNELEGEIAAWARWPLAGLAQLDSLGERDPVFPWLLGRQVSRYVTERGLEEAHPGTDWVLARLEGEDELATALGRASVRARGEEYVSDVRLLLLSFCLREGIRLGHVLDTAAGVTVKGVPQFEPLCDALRNDVALFAVTEGVLAFWKVG